MLPRQSAIYSPHLTQTPPLGIYETVAQAPLPYFLDLLGHVLTGDASLTSQLQLIEAAQDWTFFATNSPNTTDLPEMSSVDFAIRSSMYGTIPGRILYSPLLENGTVYASGAGVDLTVTKVGNDTYFNDAKIIRSDVLVSNGVLHVLDKVSAASKVVRSIVVADFSAFQLLDPNHPDARPSISAEATNQAPSGGLSAGAKAGIAIGVVGAVAIIGAMIFIFWRRKRRNSGVQWNQLQADQRTASDSTQVHEVAQEPKPHHELEAQTQQARPHGAVVRYADLDPASVHGRAELHNESVIAELK